MPNKKRKGLETADFSPEESSNRVLLRVGNAVIETTKETLLSRDQNSFFHVKLSGRWKNGDELIIDRDGMLFLDVMIYLRYGDLPGGHKYGTCKLSVEHLKLLKEEAEFLLLPGLVEMCDTASNPYLRFGSIGDFDDSQYTDFSFSGSRNNTRYETAIEYTVKYMFNGKGVTCNFEMESQRDTCSIVCRCSSDYYLNNMSFSKCFKELQAVISAGAKTVSSAMDNAKIKIAPEAQLYMAFVIDAMLCYYDEYAEWDGGEYDSPLTFLYQDTTWGDFDFAKDDESDEESGEECDD